MAALLRRQTVEWLTNQSIRQNKSVESLLNGWISEISSSIFSVHGLWRSCLAILKEDLHGGYPSFSLWMFPTDGAIPWQFLMVEPDHWRISLNMNTAHFINNFTHSFIKVVYRRKAVASTCERLIEKLYSSDLTAAFGRSRVSHPATKHPAPRCFGAFRQGETVFHPQKGQTW